MTRLVLEVELQFYGEDKQEQREQYENLANVLTSVVDLMQTGLGTFVKSRLEDE